MAQGGVSYPELTALLGKINNNSLLVRQLQAVCGNNGLSRGGVKAELRNRLVNRKPIHHSNSLLSLSFVCLDNANQCTFSRPDGVFHARYGAVL